MYVLIWCTLVALMKEKQLCYTRELYIKEILLKIGLIEKMATTLGNRKVPQSFFHNSSCSRKCNLLRGLWHFLLSQVVLTFSTKPILSCITLRS